MLRLFSIRNSCFENEEAFEKYLALVDSTRREKINNLTVSEKRSQLLAAGVILPLALKRLGYSGEIEITYGEYGKPRLAQPKGLFFNISHSGEWTALALSDVEAGLDIQQIKPVDMRLADRFFTPEERQELTQSVDPQDFFFRLWTVKESYMKALGTGLTRPLGSFTVRFNGGAIRIDDPLVSTQWFAVEVNALPGYKTAVCTSSPHPAPELEILTVS